MGSTCRPNSGLDKTLPTCLKHLRKIKKICKSPAMSRNRENYFTTIMPNFKTPKG